MINYMFSYIILFCALFMLFYFLYMIIREGICRVVKLYLIAFSGYGIKRRGYKYPDAILALKKLNYIFAKYTLYRLLDL